MASISLAELTMSIYGIKTTPRINPLVSSVGASVTKIMNNNPNRVSFIIVNLSANIMYISPENDVSSSKGIILAASGGSFIVQWDRDFELVSHEWYCIAGGAASSIYILENISV